MKKKIIGFIKDVAFQSAGCMHNSSFDLQIISNLDVPTKARKPKRVRSVFWSLSEVGEVKVNSDGATLGNPGKGRAGVVFRASDGLC
ncbi:hypothetical protein GIB67_042733 [Kingdonia uniflora]|uniref:Uncharacterized protein n=1 Tax=Kingdonia uniflora TaxID=39325 RepID=A0A7J7NDU5_9MAGN|nr:hypothetical protein GIB67_042733 [Kingdonia uniflora]